MLNQSILKYFLAAAVFCGLTFGLKGQSIEDHRFMRDSRVSLADKYFYVDSIIRFSKPSSKENVISHILRAELLKSEDKQVDALAELISVSTDIGTSEFPNLLGIAYLEISDIYIQKGSFKLADKYLVEAYTLFNHTGNKDKKAVVLIKSAHVAKKSQNYAAAINHLKSAHQIYSDSDKDYILDEISREIGTLAFEAGDFVQAKKYLYEALEGYKERSDYQEQITIYEALGQLFSFEKDFSSQILMQENVFELAKSHSPLHFTVTKGNELVIAYSKANRNRDALLSQLEIIKLLGREKSEELYLAELKVSTLYSLNGKETDAIMALHRANNVALAIDSVNLVLQSTKHISEFYHERGDSERAYEFLSVHDSLLQRVLNEKSTIVLIENEESLATLKDTESTFLDRIIGLSTFWKLIFLGTLVILVTLLVLAFIAAKRKTKVKRILEWRVYKRTKELKSLNTELNTYIYRSSHDLRNPLTSIKSLISLLKKEEHGEIGVKYLELIEDCTEQMDEILLNLSRAVDYKRVDLKVEQVSFSKLKEEIEEQYSEVLKGLTLDWNIREKAPFFSDPSLIKVILNKTISNSLQYRLGSSGDFCKVSITTDSQGAHVSIEDNGQGISEKVKDRVFDMFEKGTHKSKGAGLGLYLVKIACEKIRAKISLESKENQGAKLDFRLPNLY